MLKAQWLMGMQEQFITVMLTVSVMASVNIGAFINSARTLRIALWWVLVMVRV